MRTRYRSEHQAVSALAAYDLLSRCVLVLPETVLEVPRFPADGKNSTA
jgi:hypothetical protein